VLHRLEESNYHQHYRIARQPLINSSESHVVQKRFDQEKDWLQVRIFLDVFYDHAVSEILHVFWAPEDYFDLMTEELVLRLKFYQW
jgi:hypothetical protein